MNKFLFLTCLSFSTFASESIDQHEPPSVKLAIVPVIGYSSDSGLGFGLEGAFYQKAEHFQPYLYETDFSTYFTLQGEQRHSLRLDVVDVAGLPLRFRGKLGFFATATENYCGKGMAADCNQQFAASAFSASGLPSSQEASFLAHYFQLRFMEPYAIGEVRWMLRKMPHKVELIGIWRGSYYIGGTWGDPRQYAHSLFVRDFEQDQQFGFASVLEGGVMIDNRDNEPAPVEGYWAEATLREASPYWGSKWSYLGFNLSVRGYWPLAFHRRLVLAIQAIYDGVFGDIPLEEVVKVGGTLRATAFGGNKLGRGISDQYFPGRAKIIKQLELRYRFWGFDFWNEHLDFALGTFADIGVIYWDWKSFMTEPFKPLVGTGVGLRINWNDALVIRGDLAISPIENYNPRFYVMIGNVF